MTIRGIDLFSGGGGSSWGARDAGVVMVGAVDAWDVAARVYEDNFPTARGNVVCAKLSDESGPEIFSDLGKIDILIASPECTHHSVARGSRPRCDESRRSGWYVMRFIEELAPRWIVLENVTPMRNWPGFEELIAALEQNYNIRMGTLDASNFGVPQNRRRLFIVGDREKVPSLPTGNGMAVRNVTSILDRAGRFRVGPFFNGRRAEATIGRFERGCEALGKGKDFLVVYYGSDQAGGWQPLDRPLRTLTTLDRFGVVQWSNGEPTFRMLQVPEMRKAMGLPASFRLRHGTRRDHVKILGNGVCAPVMKSVIEELIGSEALQMAA